MLTPLYYATLCSLTGCRLKGALQAPPPPMTFMKAFPPHGHTLCEHLFFPGTNNI